jgi:hypothetical protein
MLSSHAMPVELLLIALVAGEPPEPPSPPSPVEDEEETTPFPVDAPCVTSSVIHGEAPPAPPLDASSGGVEQPAARRTAMNREDFFIGT